MTGAGRDAAGFTDLDRIRVDPDRARIYAEGWQSWTPTTTYRFHDQQIRPASALAHRSGYGGTRPVIPADRFQADGLLVVDPGNGEEVVAVCAVPGSDEVPEIRAVSGSDEVVAVCAVPGSDEAPEIRAVSGSDEVVAVCAVPGSDEAPEIRAVSGSGKVPVIRAARDGDALVLSAAGGVEVRRSGPAAGSAPLKWRSPSEFGTTRG